MNDLDTNIPNASNNIEDEIKVDNNNPLSVRVDTHYKEMFNKIIKENGISKKQLMESMISSYIESDTQKTREEHINFSNDINLISSSLDEIFRVINSIVAKSQDTMGSTKSSYEQRLKNTATQIDTLKNNITDLQDKNNNLELSNNKILLEKEKLQRDMEEVKKGNSSLDLEINSLRKKNIELLEEINLLRSIEKENHVLKSEIDKESQENQKLKGLLRDKDFEAELLNKKVERLTQTIEEVKSRKNEELNEIEYKIKQENEIDKKTELLKIQAKYNDLQAENLKVLGLLNQKSEEIFFLKSKLKED